VKSEPLSPLAWLEQTPLQPSERLYLVMSSASDAHPLKAFLQTLPMRHPLPIWRDTPYATWDPVMPYVIELTPDNSFLDWIVNTDADDWGWLAVSTLSEDEIATYLRSLTLVRMPDHSEAFFRFWDGRHLALILEYLGADAGKLLPVFSRYLINGHSLDIGQGAVKEPQPYPWWEVPQALLDHLAEDDPTTLVDNLMQWLREDHPAVYFSATPDILRVKVERFVGTAASPKNTLNTRLIAYLQQDVAP
jgi:Domain of unknown function (DUF4123)